MNDKRNPIVAETPVPEDFIKGALEGSPFQAWLGIKLQSIDPNGVTFTCPFKDDIISNPVAKTVHGGVLASVIDLGGLFALMAVTDRVTSTIDLKVDYHRPATQGPLICTARVIDMGGRIGTASTEVRLEDGTLLASGRGLYNLRRPKA
ncbi:MAG: PaaI family thioesterase [Alphaproteobacteria bacterium]